MTRVMDTVMQQLEGASAWLTTDDVMHLTGRSRGSAGRALRRLWYYDKVEKQKKPGDRCTKWATPTNAQDPNFPLFSNQPPLALVVSNPTPNQGAFDMQIEAAVETVASEWVTAQKTFSAHDVTKELRDRLSAGTLQIDPGSDGTVHVGGKDVAKITHTAVRDAIHALMTSGKYDYNRAFKVDHFEYSPKVDDADPTDPGTPQTPPVSNTPYDGSSTL